MNNDPVLPMFQVPNEMFYEKMIHELSKMYGQCKYYVAKTYTEIDYWEMLCFENLEGAKMKYQTKNK